MMKVLTLHQILDAIAPAWKYANKTTEDGMFIRPDYRSALEDAWLDIVVHAASVNRADNRDEPASTLNVAMVRRDHGQ